MIPLLRDERTDDRERTDLGGQLREGVGDFESLDGRGDGFRRTADFLAGMGIPRFELARAPFQPDRDQRLLPNLAPLIGRPRLQSRQQKADTERTGSPQDIAARQSEGTIQRRARVFQWFHENSGELNRLQKMSSTT